MMTRIYDLSFDLEGDQVHLEQSSGCGEFDRVTLHRVHVAHLAEIMGIMAGGAAVCVESSRSLQRENATLRRRLQTLLDRIEQLNDDLADCGHHEDLRYQQAYSLGTWELARDFCADLDASNSSLTEPASGWPEPPTNHTPIKDVPDTPSQRGSGAVQLTLEAA